jgi:DNA-binding TFAR19-related protein (PDSD5 family)
MSDRELEALRQRKLQALQKRKAFQEQKKEHVDPHKILNTVFKGRAWEVFNVANAQFPSAMPEVERLLVRLALEGKIIEIDGEELYAFLREIGLPVRLNTTINFLSHGKTKSLSEKFKQDRDSRF